MRNVVLILGDQLSLANPALAGFDPRQDRVLMVEAPGEATHVWSHKARIALFLAAMRHFSAALEAASFPLTYIRLGDTLEAALGARFAAQLVTLKPACVIVCEPGEWRMLKDLQDTCAAARVALEVRPDTHFLCSRDEFAAWAGGAKTLRMEFFYRTMRRRTGVLMAGLEPEGGVWNYDKENRSGFGRAGPGPIPAPRSFEPDSLTREVVAEVETRFPQHPGSLAGFDWPVTRADALAALDDFIVHRLAAFGPYQDAMWTDTPFAWHSRLAAALNLKLIDPREAIGAAVEAWRAGQAPLASVEGFVRQILGWREFIRGVYWLDMPGLADANHLRHTNPLPAWYWTGETQMNCARQAIGQTLRYGYAHHIQRLMVTGNFALLAAVDPRQVCDWYLAVYVDAVDWVERPNTAGMALYANGGRFTSKPYIASGAYVRRMSNYCAGCRYRPDQREGPDACPFTALYWHFLDRNERWLAANPRTGLMARQISRLPDGVRRTIRANGDRLLATLEHL